MQRFINATSGLSLRTSLPSVAQALNHDRGCGGEAKSAAHCLAGQANVTRKQTPEPGSPIAQLRKAAKLAVENGSFDEGLDRFARQPDTEKPAFGEKNRLRTPEEQRAEIERAARKRGIELGDDASEDVLREVAKAMRD